ncbi:hypothetical protein LTR22_013979 [Elasticomyces elasticus]|nr:hypothetical protein LTR22_013979 [Elasticomyces elasticus]KAK4916973.1 hypothetical protein LTR49_015148 [Elasticomyces elasticus]KAK5735504.1 hypothetical protein LTS12_026446 [Elasticomyces elasticus]
MNEEDARKQQEAYKVDGVDENEPAMDPKKRKAQDVDAEGNAVVAKKQKAEPKERINTAIYVTGLPDDVDVEELYDVFKKYGVIAESVDDNTPRIKLYNDNEGNFKGEALIVYLRPESVGMAVDLGDGYDFRTGQSGAALRVTAADASYKSQKDQPLKSDEAKKKGTNANHDRQKVIKKAEEMNGRLADWDDDDPSVLAKTSSRWDKLVVLENMFTIEGLAADPGLALDIDVDVKKDGMKFGKIANVTIFDLEEKGIVTVRFTDVLAARACVRSFNGRQYEDRRIVAYTADGTEKFRKARKTTKQKETEETARLEAFSADLEKEELEKSRVSDEKLVERIYDCLHDHDAFDLGGTQDRLTEMEKCELFTNVAGVQELIKTEAKGLI